jgi:hypothetical protein
MISGKYVQLPFPGAVIAYPPMNENHGIALPTIQVMDIVALNRNAAW